MTALLLFLLACGAPEAPSPEPVVVPEPAGPEPRAGNWSGRITTPGGSLPFGLDLSERDGEWQAWLVNGPERIEVPEVTLEDGTLTLEIAHYDAGLVATVDPDGERLEGHWEKTVRELQVEKLPFEATWGRVRRFQALPVAEPAALSVDGTWDVAFSKTDGPTLALLRQEDGVIEVEGTVLTPTGDYRWLAGSLEGNTLRLSTFDGAHAFLFKATLTDGQLAGDFWSGAGWHETFTARPAAEGLALPDGFDATEVAAEIDWSAIRFPDHTGNPRTLADPAWSGHPRLIQIMGSWCPNCNDQTELLKELDTAWSDKGLKIVSLAFEHGDAARNAAQIRRYREHHGITWPTLIAGFSVKKEAAKKLPFLDTLHAYPTLLFVDADGTVVATHTGFVGPAAPDQHAAVKAAYERTIAALVASTEADPVVPTQ